MHYTHIWSYEHVLYPYMGISYNSGYGVYKADLITRSTPLGDPIQGNELYPYMVIWPCGIPIYGHKDLITRSTPDETASHTIRPGWGGGVT